MQAFGLTANAAVMKIKGAVNRYLVKNSSARHERGLVLCLSGSASFDPGTSCDEPHIELKLSTSRFSLSGLQMLVCRAIVRCANPSRVTGETVGTPGAARDLCVEYPCFSTDTSVLMIQL